MSWLKSLILYFSKRQFPSQRHFVSKTILRLDMLELMQFLSLLLLPTEYSHKNAIKHKAKSNINKI